MKLTCATYNILHGYHRDLILKNIEFLIHHGADILCLQEADAAFEEPLRQLFQKAELMHWRVISAHTERNGDVALLWNTRMLDMRSRRVVPLPKLRTPMAIDLIRGITTEIQRAALIAEFDWRGRGLQVTNAHLSWEGGARLRLRQLRHIRMELEQTPADYRIVTGDFNTVALRPMRGRQEKRVEKILGTEFRNAFPKMPWTYDISAAYPNDGLQFIATLSRAGVKWRQRFDYMFAKDMTVMSAQMHDLPGSDHRPLIATFSIAREETIMSV